MSIVRGSRPYHGLFCDAEGSMRGFYEASVEGGTAFSLRITTRVKRHTAPRRDKHLATALYFRGQFMDFYAVRRVAAFFILVTQNTRTIRLLHNRIDMEREEYFSY